MSDHSNNARAIDRDDDLPRPGEDPRSAGTQHDQAVVQAEIKRLVHALGPYGVLSRDALRREVGADSWHDSWFDRALEAAVRDGRINELPFGFYALRRGASRR